MSAGAYPHIHGMQPEPEAQLNISEEHEDYEGYEDYEEYDESDWDWPYTADLKMKSKWPPHPSIAGCRYFTSREEAAKKALIIPPPPPFFDASRWYFEPDATSSGVGKWNTCHLLSLPKELRLEIWKYVLSDPSVPDLVVRIRRQPSSPCYKLTRAPDPRIRTSLRPPRNCPINLNLLLVNRFIYEEALPILYGSVKFAPSDLEGIFPVFLDSLSPSALPLIRHIKLSIPDSLSDSYLFGDISKPLFHWAITCAQVAKLNDTLRTVEVEGDMWAFEGPRNRRALLYPLCKIKAAKKWSVPNEDAQFQRLLAEADEELKAKAKLREERTKAEAEERARRAERELSNPRSIAQFEKELTENAWSADTCEGTLEGDPEFEAEAESETEDWDMVSLRSGTSTPQARPVSAMSDANDEIWMDTASTIVGKEDVTEGDGGGGQADKLERLGK